MTDQHVQRRSGLHLAWLLIVWAPLLTGCLGGTFTNEVWQRATLRELSFPRIEGMIDGRSMGATTQTLIVVGYGREAQAPLMGGMHEYITIPMEKGRPAAPFFYQGLFKNVSRIGKDISATQEREVLRAADSKTLRALGRKAVRARGFIPVNSEQGGVYSDTRTSFGLRREVTVLPYRMTAPAQDGADGLRFTEDFPDCEFIIAPYEIQRRPEELAKSRALAVVELPLALCADVVWIPTAGLSMLAFPLAVHHRIKEMKVRPPGPGR